MKTLIIFTFLCSLNVGFTSGQCTNQVLNLSGTSIYNGVNVSVTSSGSIYRNIPYCDATFPYYIGRDSISGNSGSGSYSFNFSPPISSATLNFSGLTDFLGSKEEIQIFVNGIHYEIPIAGILNNCDDLAILTPLGNISSCLDCNLSGWKETTINGPIHSLTVYDTVFTGTPAGVLFSLFICDSNASELNKKIKSTNYHLFPNPFLTETIFQTIEPMKDATITLFNIYGEKVKQTEQIYGEKIVINRENLPSGLYLFQFTENNSTFILDKIVISN